MVKRRSHHRHRKRRFLKAATKWRASPKFWRAAAIFAWALQGLLSPWVQTPAYAANPDTVTLGVRAAGTSPPATITDLLASPNLIIPGQISLTWTAPEGFSDIPGATVASYSIHYATYSVDSLLGNTTSWWNATLASSTTLQLPTYTPQPPGSFEAYTFTGLAPGTTYYFGIRSTSPIGTLSAIDTKSSTPGQQAFAVTSAIPPTTVTPRVPNGLLSTPISNGLQVTLSWTPVTLDTSGNSVSIDHYTLLRYDAIGSTATLTVTLPGSASSYTDTTGGTVYYYRIQAVSTAGQASQLSDYLDSQGNRYALATDDLSTRVVMPNAAAQYLLAANNPYNQDLDLLLIHQMQDEINQTLRSYKINGRIAATGEILSVFTFPQNNISVQLGYGSALGAAHLSPPGPSHEKAAGSIAQIVSVYWFNGGQFVPVGEPTLTSGASIAVTVRNLGIYQIRAVALGLKFRLTQGSPYPRVITPNGAENRRVFFFYDNPAGDTITGTIYDIRGAKVRDLQVNSMSPTPNSLVWDGRDNQGAVVPSGVYLYKIFAPDQTVTGTVVVAR